ncbi:cytochrome P450 [Streptomyces amakusaensis]|uniref:Cytochrome P450 n=1 Tax=Streptomyces amakusaensis TaxID=67271 RepID=A0ABW0ADS3_9ACTN
MTRDPEDTSPMPADPSELNLADPATFVRPDMDRVWHRLRTHDPVYRHPATELGPAFWVLTRYADALTVYKDPARFGSARGNMLTSLLAGGDPAGGRLLAVSDPPRHTALRTMLLKAFSPRLMRRVAEGVRVRADALIERAVAAGECDFAREVSEIVPIATICDLLGVPESDQAAMLALSKRALSADRPGDTARDMRMARNEILLRFSDLARARRARPADDVISLLVHATVDGAPLTEEEVVLNCYGLVLAGDETGRLAMTGAVLDFVRHPGQWRVLKEGRAGVESAVDEILRWNSPAMHVGRTARRDTEIGGRRIAEGDLVTVWNVSANRDERVFDRPGVFDVARTPNRHLAFGHGPHFCLGAFLGRAEIAAVLAALLERVEVIEQLGEPVPLYSTFLRGYTSLPVRLTPARRPVPIERSMR